MELIIQEQPAGGEPAATALALAARAEALALKSRSKEALDQYRQAIELADPGLVKRSWWFNLADVASRIDDPDGREAALKAAMATAPGDDISRRVSEVRRAGAPAPVSRLRGTKAN